MDACASGLRSFRASSAEARTGCACRSQVEPEERRPQRSKAIPVRGRGRSSYLAKHGTPQRPEELLQHEGITFRLTTGALYGWELERGRRTWRVPVRGGVVTNESRLRISLAEDGLGLAYVMEPIVEEQLRKGRLRVVLEPYAATVPGFFLYFPSRAQSSPALRLFVDAARELAANTVAS